VKATLGWFTLAIKKVGKSKGFACATGVGGSRVCADDEDEERCESTTRICGVGFRRVDLCKVLSGVALDLCGVTK
jgi:hypothetical protein